MVRLLMSIRTGKRLPRKPASGDLPQRLQGADFVILDDVPGEELVIGVPGKSGIPMAGVVSTLLRVILAGLLASDT